MIHVESLASLPDDELFAGVERLTARSNAALADLLAHLGEVERRGIHRLRACASLYMYCVYELRMSEDAAYRRAKAARLVREYPELHGAIAKGEIHLTGVLMIGPHLGGERHAEILRRARFRSKHELLRLIAEIDPKPEVPALVEPLGPAPAGRATHAAFVESLAGPERELPPGRRPEDWLPQDSIRDDGTSDDRTSDDRRSDGEIVPTDERGDDPRGRTEASHVQDAEQVRRPLHYRVQFTATQEFVDLLEEIRSLLGHERSGTDLPDVQLRALRALVKELRVKKRAATDRPREAVSHRADAAAPAREPHDAADATDAPARELHGVTDATARELHGVTDATAAPAPKPHVGTDALARESRRAADGTDALARESQRATVGTDALARESQRATDRTDALARESQRATDDTRPRAPARGPEPATRHIPAPVRRAVFDRDAARCAYHDDRGERCRETQGLEIHHRRAHALGGAATLENLELRCRPHNTLAAEQDFGREHMDRMRGVTGGTAPARAF